MQGTDRWGRPLDQTYEDLSFFRGAIEVIERSVPDDQAPQVREALARMEREAAGPGGGSP